MTHRGPDGRGTLIREKLGLGHRRLSIIDPEGGAQPLSGCCNTLHITYNGEIYNFREIRQDLASRGHTFLTKCDTEVVLASYAEWGKECVHRFRGMFAFAIADFAKRELFLARDRFGIKPLVYLHDENQFTFASEIQALWEIDDFDWEIDLASIDRFFHLQYIPSPRTAFRKVFKLPAGHWMVVRFDSLETSLRRYWAPEFKREKKFRTATAWEERLDCALRDSVKAHLVSDVPFGAFLSGGVDSSLMVGYMAEEMGERVKTFSIGFEGADNCELGYAREVADRYGTDHHEEIVRPDAMSILPQLANHYGEPFGDQSAVPTWYLSQMTANSVPMAISGDGADELFAGYSTHASWLKSFNSRQEHLPVSWKSKLYPLARKLIPGRYPPPVGSEELTRMWLRGFNRFPDRDRSRLWKSDYRFVSDLPPLSHQIAMDEASHYSGSQKIRYADINTYLVDSILNKVDIASMAWGLEVRPPILDTRLFEIAAQMPESALVSEDGIGKKPLKALLAKRFSHEFAWRKKQGFSMPINTWLNSPGKTQQDSRDFVLTRGALSHQFLDSMAIESVFSSSNADQKWLLLVFEHWLQVFKARTSR